MSYGRRSRPPDDDREMAVTRASARAQYYIWRDVPHDEAIAGLREITTDPALLAAAAASATSGGYDWQGIAWELQRPPVRLLVEAGADRDELRRWLRVIWDRRNDHADLMRRPPLDEAGLDASMSDLCSEDHPTT